MMNRRTFLGSSLAASVLLWSGCGSSSETLSAPRIGNASTTALRAETLVDTLIAFNSEGTRFLLDFLGHSVSRLGPSGEVVWSVGDSPVDGIFNFPVALQVDETGRLFVADRGNGEVDVLDGESGNLVQTIGRGQMTSARDLTLSLTRQEVYVCDAPEHNIKVFDFQGNLIRTIGSFGQTANGLNFPTGVDFDDVRNELHVADYGNARILVLSPNGDVVRTYGSFGLALGQLQYPKSVVTLPGGGSLVADGVGGFVTEFDPSGSALSRFRPIDRDNAFLNPEYVSLGPNNLLVVSGTPAFGGLV
jgi:DNA-binding beta-propeller fold protein YncE